MKTPVTNETILEAVQSWAKEKNLKYEAVITSSPPALLDLLPSMNQEELRTDFSGVCLTINEPAATDEAPASLGIWIPLSGKGGSYVMCRERDGDIGTYAQDWFICSVINGPGDESKELTGLEALKALLAVRLSKFLQEFVFAPALDKWLSNKGLTTVGQSPDIIAGEALEYDIPSWYIVKFSEPCPAYPYSQIVGVSGDGFVSHFNLNHEDGSDAAPDYYWDFLDIKPYGISKPSELFEWLDSNIKFTN